MMYNSRGPVPALPPTPHRGPRAIPVWLRLDAAYPHPPGAPQTTVPDGWDLVGNVAGDLDPTSWVRSARGMWLATCTFELNSADGRGRTRLVSNALVPAHALRRRE
jgi:hypothetical protein